MTLLHKKYFLILLIAIFTFSCSSNNKNKKNTSSKIETQSLQNSNIPFSTDSAYYYICKQISFGPRVPNSNSHNKCGFWLSTKLKEFGLQVIEQNINLKAYNGEILKAKNIIASFKPEKKERILLLAHWDTRPTADQEVDLALKKQAILGADDGASGVGILLEIARQLKTSKINKGIDILFVDAEDYGTSSVEESWCLGSTYWSKNPHKKDYKAKYGILLDMVGAKNAKFRWEYFSKQHAPQLIMKVWETASKLGYGSFFIQADGGGITDDHCPIIKNLEIPTIDIINYNPNKENGFGDHWHTLNDNLNIIDKSTLRAVGHTLMSILIQE